MALSLPTAHAAIENILLVTSTLTVGPLALAMRTACCALKEGHACVWGASFGNHPCMRLDDYFLFTQVSSHIAGQPYSSYQYQFY